MILLNYLSPFMMIKSAVYLLLFIVTAMLWSCESKFKNDEEKLVEMITDFHIAKAALDRYPPNERDSVYKVFTDQIFKIHGVTKSSFEYDILQLEKDPKNYQLILDKVTSKIAPNEENPPNETAQ